MPRPAVCTGGSGASDTDAVVVDVATSVEGILAEYAYLAHLYGRPNLDWSLDKQVTNDEAERIYDVLTVHTLNNGEKHTLWFDISAFYGKY